MRHLLIALWLVAIAAPVQAQLDLPDDERARLHFQAGRSYYDQGRYEESADEFMEAYRLSARHELLLNAANSYERGLLFDRAIDVLETWLRENPDHESRVSVEQRLASLERLRDRHGAQPSETETDPEAETSEESVTDPLARPPQDDGRGEFPVGPVITLGAAGAIGAASLILGLAANGSYADLEEGCTELRCPPELESTRDEGRDLAIASTGLMFGAIVVGAGGLVWLLLSGGDTDESDHVQVRAHAAPIPGGGLVGMEGQW